MSNFEILIKLELLPTRLSLKKICVNNSKGRLRRGGTLRRTIPGRGPSPTPIPDTNRPYATTEFLTIYAAVSLSGDNSKYLSHFIRVNKLTLLGYHY